ncbi:MAG: ABC transporter ATP-binding protein [Oscillospiraceae bacterium]|nr:ABC transporter ATP-binding protein [Oscillospiraceae bacterium]
MLMELKDVSKIYTQKHSAQTRALDHIDLSIQAGEMIAIRGASGAGKSTLLHILGCLDTPTQGRYMFHGEDVSQKGSLFLARLRNQKIGFVLQNFALIEEDTVLENVSVPLLFAKDTFGEIEKKAREMMVKFGIQHLAHKKVFKLSGGEKQRVAIARALVNNPDIVLADEPTGALDTKNSEMIMEILLSLNAQGKTVIIVTHEERVAKICKRTVVMSDGKLV